jgi:hypothetical protein
MQPRRLSVKYFVRGDVTFDLSALVPVFQRWIQQHSVEGLLIDVVDYKHVFQGPGVVLIGHEADYSFDLRDGRPGLLYTRKRELQGTLADDLRLAFRLVADAARKLEAESALNGIKFDFEEAEIMLLDRLNTPNTPEIFESIRESLRAFAGALYQSDTILVESIETDPRKPLTIRLAASQERVVG